MIHQNILKSQVLKPACKQPISNTDRFFRDVAKIYNSLDALKVFSIKMTSQASQSSQRILACGSYSPYRI